MSDILNNQTPEVSVEAVATDKAEAQVETSQEVILDDAPVAEEAAVEVKADEPILGEAEIAPEVEKEVNSNWADELPEDLKESNFLKKFEGKSLEDVLRSAISAEKLIGKKVEDFSKEDFDKYAVKQGRPEASAEYALPDEIMQADKYKDAFFDANLSKDQAKALTDKLVEAQREQYQAHQDGLKIRAAETKEILKTEFGEAYDNRINIAKNTIKEYGGNELLKSINDAGLGTDPNVIKAFAKLGKDLGEDRIISADKKTTFGVTPQEARDTIKMKKADSQFMEKYMGTGSYSKTSSEHKAAVKEMTELFNHAYNG